MLKLVFTIIIIYLFYYLWIIFNYDKNGICKRKKEKKMPVEVTYFIYKYKIDLNKINYRYFLQLIGLVVAFELSIIITILSLVKNIWLWLVLVFVLVIVFSLISFEILGRYFRKKGLTRNDEHKRNRKKVAKNMGRK